MPDTSKLEKLNRELEKSEKKLRKAINDEKALQQTLKIIKFNVRMITATTNEIILCGKLVEKPGDNNAFSAAIRTNGKTIRCAINNRRKSRSEIEIIHDFKKYYLIQNKPKRAALFRASISHPRYHRLRKHFLAALLTA